MDNKGQRRFERTDFHVKGFVIIDGQECPVNVINISLKGILVEPEESINHEINKIYPLRISLPHSEISIQTESKLIHDRDGQCGFRFESVEAESMIHLRRLLELNISSDEEVEKELFFLMD